MRAYLWQGSQYYPETPSQDYTGHFDTPEQAKQYAIDHPAFDWWEVLVDEDEGKGLEIWEHGRYS